MSISANDALDDQLTGIAANVQQTATNLKMIRKNIMVAASKLTDADAETRNALEKNADRIHRESLKLYSVAAVNILSDVYDAVEDVILHANEIPPAALERPVLRSNDLVGDAVEYRPKSARARLQNAPVPAPPSRRSNPTRVDPKRFQQVVRKVPLRAISEELGAKRNQPQKPQRLAKRPRWQ